MQTLEKLIAAFFTDVEFELEMCLCRKNVTERPNELAQDVAHEIATTLQKSAEEGNFKSTNRSFVDYFYDNGAIRHRCFLDENKHAETIRKTRVGRVLATCPQREYVFCFNLKREERIARFDPLEAGCPHHVRIQQEWIFEYKNAFQYIVKKVQAGGTSKEECLDRPLHFEVEIELIQGSDYARQRNPAQLARSLIAKCLDMCGRFDDAHNKEPLTMVFDGDGEDASESKPKHNKNNQVFKRNRKEDVDGDDEDASESKPKHNKKQPIFNRKEDVDEDASESKPKHNKKQPIFNRKEDVDEDASESKPKHNKKQPIFKHNREDVDDGEDASESKSKHNKKQSTD